MTQSSYITSRETLRAHFGRPKKIVVDKQLSALDRHCRTLIALSPYCILATAGANGRCDASPRGDTPGFVKTPDRYTVLLPDRPGNNRVDSFENIIDNPNVGLLFLVPGLRECIRVNGTAKICISDDRLAEFAVNGRPARAVLEVTVEEAFIHCGKAAIRSHLWKETYHIDPKRLPTIGSMLADQIAGLKADDADDLLQDSYTQRLY